MADFTGMTVKVTLKEPTNFAVQGKVANIVAQQTITLEDVLFPHNGQRVPSYTVRNTAIADLEVVDTNAAPTPPSAIRTFAPPLPVQSTSSSFPSGPPPPPSAAHVPIRAQSGQRQRPPSEFVDPAILSYGRSPVQNKTASKPPEPSTPIKSMLAKAAGSFLANNSPFVGEAGKSSGSQKAARSKDAMQQASSSRQPSARQTENGDGDGAQEAAHMDAGTKKKARRSQKKKAQDPPPVMNIEVSRNGNDMNGSVRRGKGWRQTPLLQPSPNATSPQSKSSVRKSRRQREEDREAHQNGWATEDATDIQDMGDFDFEANHKLFDKKQVFDQLRQGDTTADEDRLVSHNQMARPGTYGGKNLHPTENVLSPQLGPNSHSNELDSSSDADTELNFANGRSSSRHSTTRAKKQPSRQNSALLDSRPHPLSASMSSDRGMTRSMTSMSNKAGKTVASVGTSPIPDRTRSPQSVVSASKTQASALPPAEAHLAIVPTLTACPVLNPNGLETLELETVQRFGLTFDAITETAARCIAETALSMFDADTSSRRGSRADTIRGTTSFNPQLDRSTAPVIVIIAGNHAAGGRAVAAARHLVCRRTRIILVEAQYESSETQDPQMKTQLAMLKRLVKTGRDIKRGPWSRASGYIKNLSGPPAVIIDALLAGSTYESLLDSANAAYAAEAQKEALEMIGWANRSRAPVLSVACPSGVSGADGVATLFEGEPLAVRPEKVLCLGAPLQGLLDAMKGGERWDVSLADIGVNITLRREEAVTFGAQWVTELKFVDGEGATGEA